jgi:hypothetical protein
MTGEHRMANYKLVVFSDPIEGREQEYNDWYNEQHLQDVVAVSGFVAAQRFKLKELTDGTFRHRYLAIYDIKAEDPQKVMQELKNRAGTARMVISEALDSATCDVAVFEECSPQVQMSSAVPLTSKSS